ncbi:MAG: TRAP transporter small permease subunit [Desulfofustis sp.]|jgi:TRAP-type mannitol/chloroaromatic compound transport system permease small subunit|nr:TRAP transporter small permease subunit [Desulfofustis sp.]
MDQQQIDFGFVLPHWFYWGWLATMPIAMILWSLALEKRKASKAEAAKPAEATDPDGRPSVESNIVIRAFDWLSEYSGQFVAFWTVNAVFFYAFEVIARYIFNKPTIWVHESSFLLFGMQYLLAGAYAYLYGSHVAVDIIYNKFPKRGQYGLDIFTSVFSFVFFLTLIGTSYRFMMDSIAMRERTLETWQIQYYPVKAMMFIGGITITLATISRLYKDIKRFNQLGRSAS